MRAQGKNSNISTLRLANSKAYTTQRRTVFPRRSLLRKF